MSIFREEVDSAAAEVRRMAVFGLVLTSRRLLDYKARSGARPGIVVRSVKVMPSDMHRIKRPNPEMQFQFWICAGVTLFSAHKLSTIATCTEVQEAKKSLYQRTVFDAA